uniref:Uncharacterized protein n=1 Tax=Cacopsylla melanoneura TaxID=428564 RepID=A0A8D8WNT6_9HEMI
MAILCSTSFAVTLAISFILLQAATVSSDEAPRTANATAEQEHPELLPSKVLDLCTQTKTAVCPRGQTETEPLCQEYAKVAEGTEPLCDGINSCSFKVKLTNGMEKFVYVSLNSNTSQATIYKKCSNKLVLYSMYNPNNPNAIGG